METTRHHRAARSLLAAAVRLGEKATKRAEAPKSLPGRQTAVAREQGCLRAAGVEVGRAGEQIRQELGIRGLGHGGVAMRFANCPTNRRNPLEAGGDEAEAMMVLYRCPTNGPSAAFRGLEARAGWTWWPTRADNLATPGWSMVDEGADRGVEELEQLTAAAVETWVRPIWSQLEYSASTWRQRRVRSAFVAQLVNTIAGLLREEENDPRKKNPKRLSVAVMGLVGPYATGPVRIRWRGGYDKRLSLVVQGAGHAEWVPQGSGDGYEAEQRDAAVTIELGMLDTGRAGRGRIAPLGAFPDAEIACALAAADLHDGVKPIRSAKEVTELLVRFADPARWKAYNEWADEERRRRDAWKHLR